MSKPARILAIVGGSIAGLAVVAVVATLIVLQSSWFGSYVKNKIVSVAEESTGGVAQLGSFQFDWRHLTVRIRNFVLHGTEPKTAMPLLRIDLLEIHLKLFSGIMHAVDIAYAGIEHPQVNIIVFPDGNTNIPQPKVKKQSSNGNPLQTIIDLKIGKFNLNNGYAQFAQQKTAFSGKGENLHLLFNYNSAHPSYSGNLSIQPLSLASGDRPAYGVDVNIPIAIEGDAVRIANGTITGEKSKIDLDASLQNMKAPVVDAKLNADIALPELARSFALPLHTKRADVPQELTAEFALHSDDSSKLIQLTTAHIGLGRTTFQASGTLRGPGSQTPAQFNGNLDLAQLEHLLDVTSPQATGQVLLNGNINVDQANNYDVNGTINSRDLSVTSGTAHLADVNLYTPFHADPYLISLDGLRLKAAGGTLGAKLFVEKMKNLSLEASLNNFSVPVLAAVATGKHLGYDGTLNGNLKAIGDLAAKGTTGYRADAHLRITPGNRGVPLSGDINANYVGSTGLVDLHDSFVALPHSRLQLAGALDKELNLSLVSSNLNDFLPAANFGAAKPATSLPITLHGGTANIQAQVTGQLSSPRVQAHAAITKFSVENAHFDQLAMDLNANSSAASITNGSLSHGPLDAAFNASVGLVKWSPTPRSPLNANFTLRGATVADLLSMANESSIPATGNVTADAHIHGTYGNPLGNAVFQISNGTAYDQPFSQVLAKVNLSDQLITVDPLQVVTDAGSIALNATFHHPRDSFSTGTAQVHVTTPTAINLAQLKPVQERSAGAAGIVQLTADAALSIKEVNQKSQIDLSSINANLSAQSLRLQNQSAGDLTLTASTINRRVSYRLVSNFAGSDVHVDGATTLATDYPTQATASIRRLDIAKVLAIAGQGDIPASGTLSADASVSGTIKNPSANANLDIANGVVYQEQINRLAANLTYNDQLVNVPSLQLDIPAGTLHGAASFSHPANDLNSGTVKLTLNTSDIQLAKVEHLHRSEPTLRGSVKLVADVAGRLQKKNGSSQFLPTLLNADLSTAGLRLNRRDVGSASFNAKTTGNAVNFRFDSDIAKADIRGRGSATLAGDYPMQAKLTFGNIKYSNLAPFIQVDQQSTAPAFDAAVAGEATVSGPALNPADLSGHLELTQLEARTLPRASLTGAPPGRPVVIANKGPIVLDYKQSVLNIQQFHLAGPSTDINASGKLNLKSEAAPIDVRLAANLDLSVLQDVNHDFYSNGTVTLDTAIHGSFAQPLANGRVELKNVNINYATVPNGLSNGNGVILLTGTGAVIQNLTGESGGGKISVTGFAGLTGRAITYNIKANANKVRVRYSGISVTSNAAVTLIGNSNRSLAGGTVTIERIAYNSSSDAGSILSRFASTPPSIPSAPSELLTGMRLNIHILTSPDLRVNTTYANRLSVEANLNLRGTAADPGMVGRLTVTDGQLVFFGNTYTVTTGVINFYSTTSIQPNLNFSLQTLAQGVDVTLGVSGTMDNLQLSYRSDPPLTFEQIVQLLATNTTPADPNIVANQPPAPQQSFTQMGESAILGQAVANPLASRVQRVFGLSQFKIDPSVAGNNGQPSARVTLQQKIANNITFTYITDVTQTNSEIIRVQWDLTPRFSAVGLRDYNGNVTVQFFYKWKVR